MGEDVTPSQERDLHLLDALQASLDYLKDREAVAEDAERAKYHFPAR
jgi:hypothetical protein